MTNEEDGLSVAELEGVAGTLVEAGRRADAISLVESLVGPWDGDGGLLLARLHLGRGTPDGTRAAVDVLEMSRAQSRLSVEGIALLRFALCELGRHAATRKLDRDLRWTGPARRRTSRAVPS